MDYHACVCACLELNHQDREDHLENLINKKELGATKFTNYFETDQSVRIVFTHSLEFWNTILVEVLVI